MEEFRNRDRILLPDNAPGRWPSLQRHRTHFFIFPLKRLPPPQPHSKQIPSSSSPPKPQYHHTRADVSTMASYFAGPAIVPSQHATAAPDNSAVATPSPAKVCPQSSIPHDRFPSPLPLNPNPIRLSDRSRVTPASPDPPPPPFVTLPAPSPPPTPPVMATLSSLSTASTPPT
jgi:hypothetical protein